MICMRGAGGVGSARPECPVNGGKRRHPLRKHHVASPTYMCVCCVCGGATGLGRPWERQAHL